MGLIRRDEDPDTLKYFRYSASGPVSRNAPKSRLGANSQIDKCLKPIAESKTHWYQLTLSQEQRTFHTTAPDTRLKTEFFSPQYPICFAEKSPSSCVLKSACVELDVEIPTTWVVKEKIEHGT